VRKVFVDARREIDDARGLICELRTFVLGQALKDLPATLGEEDVDLGCGRICKAQRGSRRRTDWQASVKATEEEVKGLMLVD
jgi:hypothetical protein